MLKLLLIRILRQQNEQDFSTPIASNGEHVLMSRFFDYLETHLSEPVHVEQLCAALGVSRAISIAAAGMSWAAPPVRPSPDANCAMRSPCSKIRELSIVRVAEADWF